MLLPEGFSSTFFYPTRGGPYSFELVVSSVATDPYSVYLLKQKPGIRQFKFRGPIGPGISIAPSLSYIPSPGGGVFYHGKSLPELVLGSQKTFRNVVFIGQGEGLLPFIQILRQTFLKVWWHNSLTFDRPLPLCIALDRIFPVALLMVSFRHVNTQK